MIDPDEAVFPNNIVELILIRTPVVVDADLFVIGRALRTSDPAQSVGVSASTWNPNEDSFEIDPNMKGIPTLQRYTVTVQAFIKDPEEPRGLRAHSVLSKRVRSMLYTDTPLQLGFAALQVTSGGKTETSKRWSIESQRFVSNELQGNFLYLSSLTFWMETETRG